MARETSSVVGSGTVQALAGILPPDERGVQPEGRGEWRGTNVVVINPEDLNSVTTWAVSGVTVGQTPVELVGPENNPLPRSRAVRVFNNTPNTILFVGPSDDEAELRLEGAPLQAGAAGTVSPEVILLPLLRNASVWAVADTGDTIDVRIVIL